MNTEATLGIAREREAYMKDFIDEFMAEREGKR